MKEYKCEYKSIRWYEKINYMKICLVLIISFSVSFLIFYFLGKDFDNAIGVSFIISILLSTRFILNDLLENRETIYLIDDNSIKYIEAHDDRDGRFITSYEYDDVLKNVSPTDIYKNIKEYFGIDCGEITKIIKIHKNVNNIKIYANVKEKVWKGKGFFSFKNVELTEQESKKKLIITNDYERYDDICKILSKKV